MIICEYYHIDYTQPVCYVDQLFTHKYTNYDEPKGTKYKY